MQLLASSKTEIASSTAGNATSSEVSLVPLGSEFDENFKISFAQAQQSDSYRSLLPVVVEPSDTSTELDAEIILDEPHEDWHELLSQSTEIDTALNITSTAPTSEALIADDSLDSQHDNELLALFQNQPVTSVQTTDVEDLDNDVENPDNDVDSALNVNVNLSPTTESNNLASNTLVNESESTLPPTPHNPEATLNGEQSLGQSEELLTATPPAVLEKLDTLNKFSTPGKPDILDKLKDTAQMSFSKASDPKIGVSEVAAKAKARSSLNVEDFNIEPSEQLDRVLAKNAEQVLTQLSPKQLEQVAQHIYARLEQSQKNLGDAQHFVSNLKGGLAEIKAQLQDGHVAGIDLSALIKDSLPKTDTPALKLDQVVQQLTNSLGVLGMNATANTGQVVDTQHVSLDVTRHNVESSTGQLEQTKLPQQTQNAFDKSVNLFKPEGQQQLADKVRWMNNNRQISAELRLDPEDLGAMQVKITMQGDTATVNMVVQTTQARDMLEQATPRLREMLAEQGLALGESAVNQENSAGQQGHFEQDEPSTQNASVTKIDETLQTGNIIAEQSIHNGSVGGIDYYA